MILRERIVPSPLGPLRLLSDGLALVGLYLPDRGPALAAAAGGDPVLAAAAAQLGEYFAGGRIDFDLPLDPHGTPFQRAVWTALQAIPHGATSSYGALAARLGRPRAARAVGAANGQNPISIVIPCHRVIGADGSATGYGGGIAAKQWLLEHERAVHARAA